MAVSDTSIMRSPTAALRRVTIRLVDQGRRAACLDLLVHQHLRICRLFYFENKKSNPPSEPTTVPLGLASFGYDFKPPRKFADRDHANIVQRNEYQTGGHWAAHEVPALMLDDLRGFFSKVI